MKFQLSASIVTACHAVVDLAHSQDEQLKAAVKNVFTPEILGNKEAYQAARGTMEDYAVRQKGYSAQSARVFVYRLLQRAEITAPGKNAGAANGNAKAGDAAKAEAAAIVGRGFAQAMNAIEAALRANDFSKARRIIDALQDAHKAEEAAKDAANNAPIAEPEQAAA